MYSGPYITLRTGGPGPKAAPYGGQQQAHKKFYFFDMLHEI